MCDCTQAIWGMGPCYTAQGSYSALPAARDSSGWNYFHYGLKIPALIFALNTYDIFLTIIKEATISAAFVHLPDINFRRSGLCLFCSAYF